mgnify:CR=1 FL=1
MSNYVVYSVIEKSNGKTHYIGITCNFSLRRQQHLNCARSFKGSVIHNVIRNIGENGIIFTVLERNLSKEVAINREKHYIAVFNTLYPKGCNVCNGSNLPVNSEYQSLKMKSFVANTPGAKERLQEIGKLNKGKVRTEEMKQRQREVKASKSKRVKCVETSIEYSSVHQASSMTGIRRDGIVRVLNNQKLSSGGHHWITIQGE